MKTEMSQQDRAAIVAAQDFAIFDDGLRDEFRLPAWTARALQPQRGWGWRYLNRFKVIGGKRYQLHATRGWKCVGRA